MSHFKVLAWLWLLLGGLGSVYKCWHAVQMGGFILGVGGPGALAWELGECVLAVGGAAAGYGLLRGWRWSRLVIELIASVLLGVLGTCLLFADIGISAGIAIYGPPVIFALYSLAVTLFCRYEPRRA
jgi:hypothetical protein